MVLALLFVAIVSCSGVPEPEAAPPTVTDPLGPALLAFDSSDELPGRPVVAPVDMVRLALVEPVSWLPREVSIANRAAAIVADLLFDGLTEVGVDGELVPALATSWESDPTLTTWTFTLDAERARAADVLDSFELLRAGNPTPATAAVLDLVLEVRAPSEGTVEFVLAGPQGGFPWLLSSVAFSSSDALGTPTGSYALNEVAGGLDLVSSDDRSGVEIRWYETEDAAEDAVRDGSADVALAGSDLVPTVGISFQSSVRSISRFLQVNDRSPEVSDPLVGVAMASGLDRALLADAVGAPSVASGAIVPNSVSGYGGEPCGGNCVAVPELPVTTRRPIVVAGSELQADLLAVVAEQLVATGIDASVALLDHEQLLTELDGGTVDLFSSGWVGESHSIDGWLPLMFGAGVGDFRNAEAFELVNAALATVDDQARWAMLREAEVTVLRSGAVVPIAAKADWLIVRDGASTVTIESDGTLRFG